MANIDRPNGFRPVRYLNGAPYNGACRPYIVPAGDAVALFVGDFVKLLTTGDNEGYTTVTQATAGAAILGCVVGFGVDPTNLNTPQYRVASTRRVVYVADDPNLIFEGQEDGDTDPLETADIGLNVQIIVAAGSTTTGASGMEIDSSTHATTATHELRLLGLVQRQDNENVLSAGGQAWTRWEVKINNHQLGSHTGVAGV